MSPGKIIRSSSLILIMLWSQWLLAQSAPVLNQELVKNRISEVNSSDTVDEKTLAAYQQTQTFLDQAEAHNTEADSYVAALTRAPAQRGAIQKRLDMLDETYDPAAELEGLNDQALSARLALARTEQTDLTGRLDALDRKLAAREINTDNMRARLLEIDQRTSQLTSSDLTISPEGRPSLVEANQMQQAAEMLALQAERRALEARIASQPARYSTMVVERAELALNLQRLQSLITELETRVSTRADDILDLPSLGFAANDPAMAIAAAFIRNETDIRDQQIEVNRQLQSAREQNQTIDGLSRAVDERFGAARRVVDFAGSSDALGQVLLKGWEKLDLYAIPDPTSTLPQLVGDTVIRRINHEEQLAELLSAATYINTQLRAADINPDRLSTASRTLLTELASNYRDRLRNIISTESELLQALSTMETSYAALTSQVSSYREYLESMLLWIPNHPPLWTLSPAAATADFKYITSRIAAISFTPGAIFWLSVLLALLLFRSRPRLQALQLARNEKISRPRDDSIRHTLFALMYSMLRAMPVPIVLLGVSSGFDPLHSPENLLMHALFAKFPFVVFVFGLMCIVCEPSGVGRVHFNWPNLTTQRLHSELMLLMRWWLPLLFATTLAHRYTPVSGNEAVGRLMILLVLLVLGYHLGITQIREFKVSGRIWFASTLNRLRVLLSAILAVATVCVVQGLVFSVVVIIDILINTLWIGTVLLLTHAVLIRWLTVTRRHLRLKELLALRKEQSGEEGAVIEEKVPDLGDISADTQQLITFLTWVGAAVTMYYIWAPLLPVLDGLSRITLWTSSGEVDGKTIINQISMTTLLTVIALASFTLILAKRLPALVEVMLRSRTSITPGARYTTSTLLNYVIIASGTVAGLSALGLQWGQLQWLVAALGVGIGFGLQEIVANFISGIIILFERPIRVGDIITIGDNDGTVIKIRIRATTIMDWDGKELLVPNKEFITGRLLNWTLSDPHTRLVIKIGVAYGSDVEQALKILKEVISGHPLVLNEPPPSVLFMEFGDSTLNLHARCFISRVEDRMPTLSALHVAINKAFYDAGIEIAFPQRDIHFDTEHPLRISLERSGSAGNNTRVES